MYFALPIVAQAFAAAARDISLRWAGDRCFLAGVKGFLAGLAGFTAAFVVAWAFSVAFMGISFLGVRYVWFVLTFCTVRMIAVIAECCQVKSDTDLIILCLRYSVRFVF